MFLTKSAQKAYRLKKEKVSILHIPISLATKYELKNTILVVWNNFAQDRYFRSKKKVNRKWEHHYLSLGTKTEFKKIILFTLRYFHGSAKIDREHTTIISLTIT